MQQVKSFGVLQTAKVMGVVNLFIGVLVAIAFFLQSLMFHRPHHPRILVFLVFVPIMYGVLGFVLTAVVCGFYNWVARRLGGIAIELAP